MKDIEESASVGKSAAVAIDSKPVHMNSTISVNSEQEPVELSAISNPTGNKILYVLDLYRLSTKPVILG